MLLTKKDLKAIHKENKGTHILTIFRADLSFLPSLKKRGNEGEKIKVFSPQEIFTMPDFFPNHLNIIKNQLS